jgi:hypothetical protein
MGLPSSSRRSPPFWSPRTEGHLIHSRLDPLFPVSTTRECPRPRNWSGLALPSMCLTAPISQGTRRPGLSLASECLLKVRNNRGVAAAPAPLIRGGQREVTLHLTILGLDSIRNSVNPTIFCGLFVPSASPPFLRSVPIYRFNRPDSLRDTVHATQHSTTPTHRPGFHKELFWVPQPDSSGRFTLWLNPTNRGANVQATPQSTTLRCSTSTIGDPVPKSSGSNLILRCGPL